MTMGERIKQKRKAKGLTQKELANLCGLATGTIQQYELNKREPKQEIIKKIASVLDVPQYSLMDFEMVHGMIADRILSKKFELEDFGADKETIKEELDKIDIVKEIGLDILVEEEEKRKEILIRYFYSLNEVGQEEAIKRVQELAQIKKYSE